MGVNNSFRRLNQMKLMSVSVALFYTIGILMVLYFDQWDISHYNYIALKHVAKPSADPNVTNRYSSTTFPGGTVGLRDLYAVCPNATTPATVENSGVWSLCRQTTDDQWRGIEEVCGHVDRCFWYLSNIMHHRGICCQGCCPYSPKCTEDMLLAGATTYVAVYTVVSAMIVSLLLHLVSYMQVLLSLFTNHVVVTRMTGITFLLSGVFLGLSLIVNHYKISLMNGDRSLSLPLFPIVLGTVRHTSVGWCMLLGWACVLVSIGVAVCWIMLSHDLVAVLSKGFPRQNPVPPPTKRRAQSMAVKPMAVTKTITWADNN